jgi:hypothetical protein
MADQRGGRKASQNREQPKLDEMLLATKQQILEKKNIKNLEVAAKILDEINYRLSVLDALKFFLMNAPATKNPKVQGRFYAVVVNYLTSVHKEIPKGGDNDPVKDVIIKHGSKFKSYKAQDDKQFIRDMAAFISAFTIAWNTMRTAAVSIKRMLDELNKEAA